MRSARFDAQQGAALDAASRSRRTPQLGGAPL